MENNFLKIVNEKTRRFFVRFVVCVFAPYIYARKIVFYICIRVRACVCACVEAK